MTVAPSSKALSLAMSMVRREAWRVPSQLIDLLRALTLDDPAFGRDQLVLLSQRDVAEWLDVGREQPNTYAWAVMRRLAGDRVLRCVGGSGSRPSAWGIDAIEGWRNVPWRVPRELVLSRIRLACAPLGGTEGPNSVPVHTATQAGFSSRSLGGRRDPVVFRSRYSESARNGSASVQVGLRDSRAQTAAAAAADYVSREMNLSPSLEPEGGRELCAALSRRAGLARLFGAPRSQLLALIEAHGVEAVRAAVEAAPFGMGVPTVEWVADELAGAAAAAVRAPLDQAARAGKLRRMIATYEAEDLDVPADLLDELAACENGAVSTNGAHR